MSQNFKQTKDNFPNIIGTANRIEHSVSPSMLPCPFCGGKAELVESGPSGKENVTHWQARCSSILSGCIGSEIDTWRCTEEDAATAWNTRTK